MLLRSILADVITEEAAIAWWLQRYTGNAGQLVKNGRANKSGTPLYDTNWSPAAALLAVIYREVGWTRSEIAKALDKSHHAVTDLFARIDKAEVVA